MARRWLAIAGNASCDGNAEVRKWEEHLARYDASQAEQAQKWAEHNRKLDEQQRQNLDIFRVSQASKL